MSFSAHLTEYAGLPVFEYRSPQGMAAERAWLEELPHLRRRVPETDPLALLAALRTPEAYAWRLEDPRGHATRDAPVTEHIGAFIADVDPGAVSALITGNFHDDNGVGEVSSVRDALVEHAPRLTGLRSLFFADLTSEECEVSWIHHGTMAPLLVALPSLERFAVRGTIDMSLEVDEHPALRSLVLQGGGLPADLARQVLAADYPALEHLELWLGVPDYGGDTDPEDLAPLLNGDVHTGVRSLGLRNAQYTDRWVKALAEAPVLPRLETLDLSLGTLTDEGAQILLDTPGFRELERLDLHHHYMSEDMEKRVAEAFTAAGVSVDVSGRKEPEDHEGWGDEDEEEWEDDEWEYRYYPSVTE